MRHGMSFERGDIVFMPFPFSDFSKFKNRPVLVITTPDVYGDFIAMALTSQDHHIHSLPIAIEDYVSLPLPKSTWIRTDKIFTFNDSLVTKIIGKVNKMMVTRSIESLCENVGKKIM